jgi:hypothetical protein
VDKLEKYRKVVQDLLMTHGNQKMSYGDVETEVIFDKERDRYQVVDVGWDGNQSMYGCSIHLDIKDEKIWIHWNSTEDDIAADLVALGVPKEDIVLSLQPPNMRRFTPYAVG